MKVETILLTAVGIFFIALLLFLIFLYKPRLPIVSSHPANIINAQAVSSDTDTINDLKSKLKWQEEQTNMLLKQQKDQASTLGDLRKLVSTASAQTTTQTNNKSIIAVAYTKGSLFTTTLTSYTPMGMYVNIKCSVHCLLFINFYTSSKNIGTPTSAQGNYNTYNLFLDDTDQSVFSQASYSEDSASVPISLNVVLPVSAGIHTVDIRAKTTGGTLQSDSSALQVMATER